MQSGFLEREKKYLLDHSIQEELKLQSPIHMSENLKFENNFVVKITEGFCCFIHSEEADRYIKGGILNAIFVFGRSAGLIGHYIDQRRLDQPLYRTPWDDIAYLKPDQH